MTIRNKKTGKKTPVEVLNLKRETGKDLTAGEQKRVKGSGGARGGVSVLNGKLDGTANN